MQTEEQLQAECTQWFWETLQDHRRMIFHVDNNSVNAIVGARKRALGVVPGPSDLVFVLKGRVIFVELKTLTGIQTDEQIDFMNKVIERGHKYIIIRTFQAFKLLVYNEIAKDGAE